MGNKTFVILIVLIVVSFITLNFYLKKQVKINSSLQNTGASVGNIADTTAQPTTDPQLVTDFSVINATDTITQPIVSEQKPTANELLIK